MAKKKPKPKPKPKPKGGGTPAPTPSSVVATPGNEGAPVQMAAAGSGAAPGTAAGTSNAAAQGQPPGALDADSSFGTGTGFAPQYQPTQTFPYVLAGAITPDTTQAGSATAAGTGSSA